MLNGIYLSLMIGPTGTDPVPQSVVDALTSIQVTTSAGQRSGFQLSFTVGSGSPLNLTYLSTGYFDPATRVIITVTVNGTPTVLMDGVITQQQLSPSNEPGQSTLTITGEDLTRMMDIEDLTGKVDYKNMSDAAQVEKILAKYGQYGLISSVIPSVLDDTPNASQTTPQHEGTDWYYINQLADKVGYVFYLEPGPAPGKNLAYWGPEVKLGQPQAALSVNMDAYSNVESLTFSYDGFSKTEFFVKVFDKDSTEPRQIPIPDISSLNPPLGAKVPMPLRKEQLYVSSEYGDAAITLIGMAKAARSADIVSGSGQLDVIRYGRVLKARELVGVRGAGATYDGVYYVKSVTHNIKRGEYKQSFTLSRNALVSNTPALLV